MVNYINKLKIVSYTMNEPEQKINLKKITDYIWEIPKTGNMNVTIRIFASEKLLAKMIEDRTLLQASNMAQLPGIYKYGCVMPDGHEGFLAR